MSRLGERHAPRRGLGQIAERGELRPRAGGRDHDETSGEQIDARSGLDESVGLEDVGPLGIRGDQHTRLRPGAQLLDEQ